MLSRGTLYHLLSSPLYLGTIVHKGKVHDGLHQAIIPQELWDRVAQQLSGSRVERRRPRNLDSRRLLTGLLFSQDGARYVPTHCSKQGRRYFYYVCTDPTSPCKRLPAPALEKLVLDRLQQLLTDAVSLGALARDLTVPELRLLVAAGRHAAERLSDTGTQDIRDLVQVALARVAVTNSKLCLEVRTSALLSRLFGKPITAQLLSLSLECPLGVRQRGANVRLVLENEPTPAPSLLLTAVARERAWAEQIAAGQITSMDELIQSTKLSRRYIQRILQLSALAPEQVERIVLGGDEPHLPFWKAATEDRIAHQAP